MRRSLVACATGLVLSGLLPALPASAEPGGLALTPPMGFNDWNAFGCNTSAQLIEQTAEQMVVTGLTAAGYQYVNVDDCWQTKSRDANGNLVPDPVKFPGGIKAVADYVHSLGMKFGIYEDAGTTTCGGYPGSLGHEQQDANTFASWDVDYLKYDQCNIPFADYPGETHEQIDTTLYTRMSDALRSTGRPIVFSMCNGTDSAALPWLWGGPVSNLWRTTTDIQDTFGSMVANVTQNAALARYAGPGQWNDPDMLEIGNGGMTVTEERSEFSLWAEMAAPLLIGTNLLTASQQTLDTYRDKAVIAVDQDRLGAQGTLLTSADGRFVFAKPLAGGDVAVALFNSTDTASTISTNASATGLRHDAAYQLTDLWSGQVSESAGTIGAFVPAHATVLYRVSAPRNPATILAEAPNTTLGVSDQDSQAAVGGTGPVTVSLTDNGVLPVGYGALTLAGPSGWRTRPSGWQPPIGLLGSGRATTAAFTATAPASGPPLSIADLTATAQIFGFGPATATLGLQLISPLRAPYLSANTTGAPAAFGQSGTDFAISAAGSGVGPATTRGAATDQYGAIYLPGAAGTDATVTTTVTVAPGSGRSAKGGLMLRDSINSGPEGVVLYVTGSGDVGMAWDATGGSTVDTASANSATQPYPVRLKLVRSGTSYTGYYSTDGTTWIPVAIAAVSPVAAAGNQDVALFHTAGAASPSTASFTGLTVS
ncbi:MAG TPA: alpha-galactosidase [Pseudonocardiaceae bacterium]